ncbi:MAG: DNA alkylation repair protein, partial [Pyrinomonadaceae bacterium]
MTPAKIIEKLKTLGNEENVVGMRRFGISNQKAFGVPTPVLNQLAKGVKKQADDRHVLAQELW